MEWSVGIDLGGSHQGIGLVNAENRIIDKMEIATKKPYKTEEILNSMAAAVRDIVKKNDLAISDLEAIGIGVPGTANLRTGILEYANNLDFNEVPIKKWLEEQLHSPVYFENDANAAAWGEYLCRGEKRDSFIMMTIGTGIGGGIIMDGRIYRGINFAAGEIGHMSIETNGRLCNCGRRGCFEEYASVTALIRMMKEELRQDEHSTIKEWCEHYQSEINGKIILEAVAKGDQIACQVFEHYLGYLSTGVTNLINLFQPEVLCIGGGFSQAGKQLMVPLKKRVEAERYSKFSERQTQITTAKLGNDAGIIGAAKLYLE